MNAPYGRYALQKFGPMIPAKLAWFLSQLPSVVVPIFVLLTSEHSAANVRNYLLLGMFLLRHSCCPSSTAPSNGHIQSKFLLCYADYGYAWVLGLRFILGSMFVVIGMGINLHSDASLAMLCRPDVVAKMDEDFAADAAGGMGGEEQTLRIPHGGLFENVSCANYLGEIIEWFGWAVAAWSLPALAHFLFTLDNLIPRARHHHLDYINKFKDAYPRNRFAVIPGVL
ncbi:putative 3-oxo-5-alpha-steroid 4-dehydrogenase 1 [Hypsibius exemplaris]|uniref:3-oxo-5-alpha-steroid 4-dehydrogenase 1 n=1 Tax=Hypsibius exemplaris TaxID=2072580 RepID=A0A1W0WUX5_HYPEX|nr:putative 3-oxo-5-alpha-steroid 4-dehydrogenase 1 [Hypsibius exemplaris]